MRTDITINPLDAFVFLAIFQTFFIAFFAIKSGAQNRKANLFQGLFLLSFAFLAIEEFLHNTGYITRMLPILGFSQPFNYSLGPAFYLYIAYSLYPNEKRAFQLHLALPVFWCFYVGFYLFQPDEIKYNSYLTLKHPDWESIKATSSFSEDPLSIRKFANELTILSLLSYTVAGFCVIIKKLKDTHQTFFNISNRQIAMVRNSFLHVFGVSVVFSILKVTLGMTSDVGMIVICYFCVYIFLTSYRIMNSSSYFSQEFSILDFPASKYQKSSLTEARKDEIIQEIRRVMEEELYFLNNLSSLSGLAERINYSAHHVSQVINERLNRSFFELLAFYRIEYAKKLLTEEKTADITIEELAEKVGYNSKSSFNAAFKKLTSLTPTEFRKQ